MRIGLVTYWLNRGQATVMRAIRHALDELGHETFVLARPTPARFARPSFVSSDDTWSDHSNVTTASESDIPTAEYLEWAAVNELDAAFFFQNLDFEGIGALRHAGVQTIGTYMWEAFGQDQADQAKQAFDTVYVLHPASRRWFADLGLPDVDLVRFAAHPEVAATRFDRARTGPVSFIFMGGYLGARKPLGPVVQAFRQGATNGATLTIKTQTSIRRGDLHVWDSTAQLSRRHRTNDGAEPVHGFDDDRIRVVDDDLPEAEFLCDLQAHDVIVGVSRWEGLGLHLYEAEALGLPLLLNHMEPYTSFAAESTLVEFVDSHEIGQRPCGLPVHEIDVASLAGGFHRLSQRQAVDSLRIAEQTSHDMRWAAFKTSLGSLLRA